MTQLRVASLSLAEILALPATEKEAAGLVHTSTEIWQQPETWKETLRSVASQRKELQAFLEECGVEASGVTEVWLVGAGTSDFIARSLVRLFREKWGCRVQAVPSTDLMIEMDALIAATKADRRLWISFSRSGESYESVQVIDRALEKYPDIRHLIVTCNKDGQMAARIAANNSNVYCLLLDDRVNDRGVAMTSSFTNMLVAGQCIAGLDDLDSYAEIVESLSTAGSRAMEMISRVSSMLIAERYSRIGFLGNGSLKGIADECALKVLEFTDGRISTMSETFLSVRHGPISWFNEQTLVVAFISGDPNASSFENGLLKQIAEQNLAGKVLAVTSHEDETVEEYADEVFNFPLRSRIDSHYLAALYVIFGQCIGMYASLSHGLRPDVPSDHGPVQRVISGISVA